MKIIKTYQDKEIDRLIRDSNLSFRKRKKYEERYSFMESNQIYIKQER